MSEINLAARRRHVLGLLVYFPEIREMVASGANQSGNGVALCSLLNPGDNLIVDSISEREVETARESLGRSFAGDYPVGF